MNENVEEEDDSGDDNVVGKGRLEVVVVGE